MAQIISEKKANEFKAFISRLTTQVDILDDLVYCQRSLRLYMRIHQALAAQTTHKLKVKQIEEIENEMVDISKEQSLLLTRLRKALEFHYITAKNDNKEISRDMGNAYISRILAGHIKDENIAKNPKSVKRRMNESQLLSHYNLKETDLKPQSTDNNAKNKDTLPQSAANLKQESLLKPKSERFAQQKVGGGTYGSQTGTVKTENNANTTTPTVVPRSIDSSRLNLLEALQKARNQNLNKFKVPSRPQADTKETIEISSSSPSTSSESSSTASDDASDVALLSPPISDDEPEELNQETFLRRFGLYTIEHSQYLKHKRTQRKRRNVQRNQKSDFHYGKLELFEKMSKRKRTYLGSPPAVAAAPKRRRGPNGSKSASTTDRSSSSSPDQKLVCFECNKNSESLRKCDTCPNVYHVKCHKNAPRPIAREVCSECYIKSKEKSRIARKDSAEENRKSQKSLKDIDLGVAPLDADN